MSVHDQPIGTSAERADPFALRCATCGAPVTVQSECDDGQLFCCAGCVAGGPCICFGISGASRHVLHLVPLGMPVGVTHWPIDVQAMKHLLARIERMAGDPRTGDDPHFLRRLETLRGHCRASSVTFDPEVAAVGRRVTVQGEDERTESFWLALPGEEHDTANTVSIAAAAGRSVAGARVGDVVYLETEGRRRWAVVMSVA
jgi:transcription elongation GreA/GreB family factor